MVKTSLANLPGNILREISIHNETNALRHVRRNINREIIDSNWNVSEIPKTFKQLRDNIYRDKESRLMWLFNFRKWLTNTSEHLKIGFKMRDQDLRLNKEFTTYTKRRVKSILDQLIDQYKMCIKKDAQK